MKTKLSVLFFICFTFQVPAEKILIEAGKPNIEEASQSTDNQLVLAVGAFDPLTERLDFSKIMVSDTKSSKYKIVQFFAGKADSQWLRKQGIKIVSYMPNNAFIVVSDSKTNLVLDNQPKIRWHGPYLSAYKISSNLWKNSLKIQNSYDLSVAFFSDFPSKSISSIIKKNVPGALIKNHFIGSQNQITINIRKDTIKQSLDQLSLIDNVMYVELSKTMVIENTEAVSAIQDNLISGNSGGSYVPTNSSIWDKGLYGSGQIVGVTDTGLDTNEDWFVHYDNGTTLTHKVTNYQNATPPEVRLLYPDRKVIGYFVLPGASPFEERNFGHGTHVVGSVAGDRQISIDTGPEGNISSPSSHGYDNDDGMAPNAQILFQDIGALDQNGRTFLVSYDRYSMWEQAFNSGVRIHSNSYGAAGDGSYSFSDRDADRALRSFEDMLILFAAGNDDGVINSIGSPGNAKNVLTVGALGHGNSRSVAGFSNRGPTDDGRIKPDITATGIAVESARGNTDTNNNITAPTRIQKSGTSMATPITAGGAALMRQYYTDGFYPTGSANSEDVHIPTGALMKATLINGAGTDVGHFNKNTGWGRVFLANSILFNDSAKQLRVWEVTNKNGLKTNEEIEFNIGVRNDQDLSVTLVWYDLPGPFGSSKTLINDLDLSVTLNGATYKGNNFSDVAVSSTGGERDSINTVEQVRIPVPTDGIYTIKVNAADIPGDETFNSFRQGFALVATGHFDNIDTKPAALTSVSNLNAETLGNNGIQLSWNGGNNADFFEVYRVEGTCATADFSTLRYVGSSESSEYTDFRTISSNSYAYKIRAGQYQGLGELSSDCVEITSQQACDFLPTFNQSSITISDNSGDVCHTELSWDAATGNCSNTNNFKYNIYRSTDSDFIPSDSNLITSVTSTSFDDMSAPDIPAYYVIRAEDDSSRETTGTSRIRSQSVGIGFISIPILEDVDTVSIMNLNYPWQVVSNNGADSSSLSYKTGEDIGNYTSLTCSAMITNTISVSAKTANPSISYKAQHDLEDNWDGVVVQISTDDGNTWTDFPPNNGYPSNFSATDPLNTGNFENECNFPPSQGAFSGTSNGNYRDYTHNLNAFVGQDLKLRWILSTDGSSEEEGFYLDSIQYPNIQVPNTCMVNLANNTPNGGFYSDPSHNGHGFSLEPLGINDGNGDELYFTIFYSYDDAGTAEWYTLLAPYVNNKISGDMDKVSYDYSVDPTGANTPLVLDTSVARTLSIDFNQSVLDAANCTTSGSTSGVASWTIGEQSDDWCINNLDSIFGLPPSTNDIGGIWTTGNDDDGWGISLAFSENGTIVAIMYYYDAQGNPRWVIGSDSDFILNQSITLNMDDIQGYGRLDTDTQFSSSLAGTITLNLGSDFTGTLSSDVTYQGSEGGTWTRENMPFTVFTAPHN